MNDRVGGGSPQFLGREIKDNQDRTVSNYWIFEKILKSPFIRLYKIQFHIGAHLRCNNSVVIFFNLS